MSTHRCILIGLSAALLLTVIILWSGNTVGTFIYATF